MQDCKELDILCVTTTVGLRAEGERLARELLSRRLAACVQLDAGLQSHFRWQGQVCEEAEVRLVIKTLPVCRDALLAFFNEHHPYDVPQFLAATLSASPAYAKWVREEVVVPS